MFPIKDIMTQNVITVTKDMSILEAAKLLVARNITGLPVVDSDGKLVGILSEFDMLSLLLDLRINDATPVEDFMTRDVISFEDTVSAVDICEFFIQDKGKRRVPITRDGRVVGLVSRADIMKLIVKMRCQNFGKGA